MNRTPEILERLRAEIQTVPPAELPGIIRDLSGLHAEAFARLVIPTGTKEGGGEDDARLLKPAEAGKLLGYSVSEVYAKMNSGVIPWITLEGDGDDRKGTRRIPLAGLRRMISERTKAENGE